MKFNATFHVFTKSRSIRIFTSLYKPHPEHEVYPCLLKDLEIVRPCQVSSTDITYIRLEHGFAYLIAIIDWYSRFVLDWQLSINMEADFCIFISPVIYAQLNMAVNYISPKQISLFACKVVL
jgi:hypothetical protein